MVGGESAYVSDSELVPPARAFCCSFVVIQWSNKGLAKAAAGHG